MLTMKRKEPIGAKKAVHTQFAGKALRRATLPHWLSRHLLAAVHNPDSCTSSCYCARSMGAAFLARNSRRGQSAAVGARRSVAPAKRPPTCMSLAMDGGARQALSAVHADNYRPRSLQPIFRRLRGAWNELAGTKTFRLTVGWQRRLYRLFRDAMPELAIEDGSARKNAIADEWLDGNG
ncbi:hypothetical protein C8R47DRAFT_1203460 [Mycena vitilis]|nr:hypothetical protein C8R47DRAFT_1203460 [Mycena vitilis]